MTGTIKIVIMGVLIGVLGVAMAAGAQAKTYRVNIPFALNGMGRPAVARFSALRTGSYQIVLRVENLKMDPGVGDLVPVGMIVICRGRPNEGINGMVDGSGWRTGLGQVAVNVFAKKGNVVTVQYSTSAPLGARGVMEISEGLYVER